jgi:hypothetical protein
MSAVPLPCPTRLRRVPKSFNWVDHRLVRDGHVRKCPPPALALYLVLLTVADRRGASWYSDRSLAAMLGLSGEGLRAAREALLCRGLVGYRPPVYQVLDLGPASTGAAGAAGSPVSSPPASPEEIAGILAGFRSGLEADGGVA